MSEDRSNTGPATRGTDEQVPARRDGAWVEFPDWMVCGPVGWGKTDGLRLQALVLRSAEIDNQGRAVQ